MSQEGDNDMAHTIDAPIIGTHNSMTYLRPQHWYGWLMLPFARCQSKTLMKQWEAGSRCFDLRVRFNRRGDATFAHGLYECRHDADPYETVRTLAALALTESETLYVRLVLEDTASTEYNEYYFRKFCRFVQLFPSLVPFQGNRKGDWKQIFEFGYKPNLVQMVGSMADDVHWWEKIMPFAYALRKNKENKKNPSGDITIYDFI